MAKVLILDTSILCAHLNIPEKETCGTDDDKWDQARVAIKLQQEEARGTVFVLPLATLIETGNHIAHARARRFELAEAFAAIMTKVAEESTPWAAFTRQSDLWRGEDLHGLAARWPELAKRKVSMGDATIMSVADLYAQAGMQVEILSGDSELRSYIAATPAPMPKRKRPG